MPSSSWISSFWRLLQNNPHRRLQGWGVGFGQGWEPLLGSHSSILVDGLMSLVLIGGTHCRHNIGACSKSSRLLSRKHPCSGRKLNLPILHYCPTACLGNFAIFISRRFCGSLLRGQNPPNWSDGKVQNPSLVEILLPSLWERTGYGCNVHFGAGVENSSRLIFEVLAFFLYIYLIWLVWFSTTPLFIDFWQRGTLLLHEVRN